MSKPKVTAPLTEAHLNYIGIHGELDWVITLHIRHAVGTMKWALEVEGKVTQEDLDLAGMFLRRALQALRVYRCTRTSDLWEEFDREKRDEIHRIENECKIIGSFLEDCRDVLYNWDID